jgi:hypothetical protein
LCKDMGRKSRRCIAMEITHNVGLHAQGSALCFDQTLNLYTVGLPGALGLKENPGDSEEDKVNREMNRGCSGRRIAQQSREGEERGLRVVQSGERAPNSGGTAQHRFAILVRPVRKTMLGRMDCRLVIRS